MKAAFVPFPLQEQGAPFTRHGERKLDHCFHSTGSKRTRLSPVLSQRIRKKDERGSEDGRGLEFESLDLFQSCSGFNPLFNSRIWPKASLSCGVATQFIWGVVQSLSGTHLNH